MPSQEFGDGQIVLQFLQRLVELCLMRILRFLPRELPVLRRPLRTLDWQQRKPRLAQQAARDGCWAIGLRVGGVEDARCALRAVHGWTEDQMIKLSSSTNPARRNAPLAPPPPSSSSRFTPSSRLRMSSARARSSCDFPAKM